MVRINSSLYPVKYLSSSISFIAGKQRADNCVVAYSQTSQTSAGTPLPLGRFVSRSFTEEVTTKLNFLSHSSELSSTLSSMESDANCDTIQSFEKDAYTIMSTSISTVIRMESKYEEIVRNLLLLAIARGDFNNSGDLYDFVTKFGKCIYYFISIRNYLNCTSFIAQVSFFTQGCLTKQARQCFYMTLMPPNSPMLRRQKVKWLT